ncbi:MAG: class I SAM-dependent methyltransferase [Candidatus Zixiibacteriota bacterium]
MSKKTADFFDGYAHDFNAIYGGDNGVFAGLINRLFRKSMRLRYQKTIEGCQPAGRKTALDIGCGPGHYGIVLAKQGLQSYTGIDFAPGMIALAEKSAHESDVADICRFIVGDFMAQEFDESFDYIIAMGFFDYIAEPREVIDKALKFTRMKAFFSFPASGGILAWQRTLRYKSRCDLFLYSRNDLEKLFAGCGDVSIEKIARDYFVTVIK